MEKITRTLYNSVEMHNQMKQTMNPLKCSVACGSWSIFSILDTCYCHPRQRALGISAYQTINTRHCDTRKTHVPAAVEQGTGLEHRPVARPSPFTFTSFLWTAGKTNQI